MPEVDPVRWSDSVPLPMKDAFELFTGGVASWWPSDYTWSQGALEDFRIEGRKDGRCTEEGPHGFQADWGRVLEWEPPHRVVLAWQISPRREPVPDPAEASRVEVRFESEAADRTRVSLEHRGFSRHGEGYEGYRDAMDSEEGWRFILDRYRERAQAQP